MHEYGLILKWKQKKKKRFADKPLNREMGNTICKTEEMRDLL